MADVGGNREFRYVIDIDFKHKQDLLNALQKISTLLEQIQNNGNSMSRSMNSSGSSLVATFQKIGSAIFAVSNALNSFIQDLKSLASVGPGRILTNFTNQITNTISSSFYNGIEKGIARFDTMKTFPQLVEGMGLGSAEDAAEVVNKLDMAVRGLPTSLDEITSSAKDLMSITGDVNEAGDLAIAINNAILASGATEQQKYFAVAQLRDLISVGKLTDREWISLSKSIPLAMGKIAKSFGLKNWKELQQAVNDGTISVEQFKKRLVELGTGEGIFVELANIQKTTIAGLRANITNAVSRLIGGNNGILTIMDEFAKKYMGSNSLVQYLYGITTWIDKLGESLRKYIFSNSDRILSIIDKFTSYDWAKFVGTFFEFNLKKMELWLDIITKLPEKWLTFGLAFGNVSDIITGKLSTIGKYLAGFWGISRLLGAGGAAAGGAAVAGGAVATGGVFAGLSGVLTGLIAAFKPLLVAGGIITLITGFAALNTLLIRASFANIQAIVEGVGSIVTTLKQASLDAKTFRLPSRKKLEQLVRFVKDFYELFVDDKTLDIGIWDFDGQVGRGEAQNMAKIIDSMSKIISSLVESAKTVAEVPKISSKKISNFKTFVGEILDLVVWMYDYRGSDQFGTAGTGERIFSSKRFKTMEKTMKNVTSIVNSLVTVVESMRSVSNTLTWLFGSGKGSSHKRHENIKTRFTYLIEDIHDILLAVNKVFVYDFSGKSAVSSSMTENANAGLSSLNGIITSLSSIVTTMKDVSDKLRWLFGKGNGKNQRHENLTKRFIWIIDDVKEILEAVNGLLEFKVGLPSVQGVDDNLTHVVSIVDSLGNIVKSISSMRKKLSALFEKDDNKSIHATIKNQFLSLVDDIYDIVTHVAGKTTAGVASASMWEDFATSIGAIADSLGDFHSALGSDGIVQILQKVRDELKKFRKAIDDTSTKIDSIGTSWTDGIVAALDASRVSEAINNLLAQFTWNTTELYGAGYAKGLEFVRGLRDATSSSFFAPNVLNLVGSANGGIIYKAFGGSIFKAKGTDTVPAMLTPGEYVLKKSAVDAVGKEFMDRLNGLDFKGALTALSKRVGMGMIPAMSPSFAVTTNSTTNHNGTINFNVSTNNPDYANQVSGKWVRKLI